MNKTKFLKIGFVFAVFAAVGGNVVCHAQQPEADPQGAEVLTRGPVHEAFAGIVTYNPQPGVVVNKAPPGPIEELPPEERPEGDNVAWIPGYWAWDDERNDFLWISGTWRALPPGRQWIAGYWRQTSEGYQWTSGYWADAAAQETTYLPPPPATVEVGPNIAAPSPDYGWAPGCWVWYQSRYAWRPGYWAPGRADWVWVPAHYVWTPRGYVFVEGFWDYSVERRGVLFAPVYFEPAWYVRQRHYYSPSIVINLNVFHDHLFLRPRYCHYYFGDYYAPSYARSGFYFSFSFHSSHHGYDPFYSHQRWEHRGDRDWERRYKSSYNYRREHENARPPRTWTAQRSINPNTAEFRENRLQMATPITQLAKTTESPLRFRSVPNEERQQISRHSQEIQKSREQRRSLETVSASPRPTQSTRENIQPATAQLPRSPIVGKRIEELEKSQAPPPPQRATKPNLKSRPEPQRSVQRPASPENAQAPSRNLESVPVPNRTETAPKQNGGLQPREPAIRQPSAKPSSPPRHLEPEKTPAPKRNEIDPRERQPQPQPKRPEEQRPRTQQEFQPTPPGLEKSEQQNAQRRASEEAARIQAESQRNARALEQRAQEESQERRKNSVERAREATPPIVPSQPQRNVPGLERRVQPEPAPRASEPVVRPPAQGPSNSRGGEKSLQRAPEQPARVSPPTRGRGSSDLLKKDRYQNRQDRRPR